MLPDNMAAMTAVDTAFRTIMIFPLITRPSSVRSHEPVVNSSFRCRSATSEGSGSADQRHPARRLPLQPTGQLQFQQDHLHHRGIEVRLANQLVHSHRYGP